MQRCHLHDEQPDPGTGLRPFEGYSWGPRVSPSILAVEDRVHAGILLCGGLRTRERPEADQFNYVSRVKTPVLMLNGRYDMSFPMESAAKPLFDLLGTPVADKKQIFYDTDHFIPGNEGIKESLAWLDKYFGTVR